jgi:GTP-binding protein HflX
MAAFKATLEELDDASLLLHVVDMSDPTHQEQIRWVEQILIDLKLETIPRLIVLNKMDLISKEERGKELSMLGDVAISAHDRSSFKPLLSHIEQYLWPNIH